MAKDLMTQSGINQDGEPFVQLVLDDGPIAQLTPSEAREFALRIVEGAEAAEQDAFMLEFFQGDGRMSREEAGTILVHYRKWREAKGKVGPPSDPVKFIRKKVPSFWPKGGK